MKTRYLLIFALVVSGCELVGTDNVDEEIVSAVSLPVPTGPFGVGTVAFEVVDSTRDDGYTAEVGDARDLMVQVWYPTRDVTGQRAPYMSPTIAEFLAATQDYLPAADMLQLAGELQSNSIEGASVAGDGPFPIVFYSHGLTGVRALYTTLAEDLASRGYIVVGTDHTYGALAVEFPDGRIATLRTAGAPAFPVVVQIWAEDLMSVLDELERRNENDPAGILTGAMDLTRVGATGHSTGGSAAIQVHMIDDRFSAASSLDAPQVGAAAEGGNLDDPSLLFFANPSDYFDTLVQSRLAAPGYTVTMDATTHYNFMDLPTLLAIAGVAPAETQGSSRPIGLLDPATNRAILIGYTAAFFDRYLKGLTAPLLDGSPPWPEADFQIIVAP